MASGFPDDTAAPSRTDRILVVIPCLNEEAHVAATVRAALSETAALDATVVVVDGLSTDRTRVIVEGLMAGETRLHLLVNPKRIQSAAVNLAVAQYGDHHDVLVRLDAHSEYPPGFVAGCLAASRAVGADAVVVPLVTRGQGFFQRSVAVAQNSRLGNGGSPHRSKTQSRWVDHGHHALIDLAAYREAGGYDETFSHNEDAELDVRLRAAGRRIWLDADLAVVYFPRSAPWPLLRQYFNYGRGRARTMLKHAIFPKLRQLLPAFVLPALLVAPVAFPWTALPFAAWLGLSLAIGLMTGLRERRIDASVSGVAAAIMHFGWSVGFWYALARHLLRSLAPSAVANAAR